MQNTLAPTPSEVVELLKDAMARGATIILPAGASPPDAGPSLTSTLRLLFRLTSAEARAFAALLEHNPVSKEKLHIVIAQDGDPTTNIKLVGVLIHKLRKKLHPHGIAIETLWGEGFRLAEDSRDKVDKIFAAHGAELASTRPQAKTEST